MWIEGRLRCRYEWSSPVVLGQQAGQVKCEPCPQCILRAIEVRKWLIGVRWGDEVAERHVRFLVHLLQRFQDGLKRRKKDIGKLGQTPMRR